MILAAAALAATSVLGDYRIAQSVPVAGGRIEVLEDARLDRGLAKAMWGTSVDPRDVLAKGDPRLTALAHPPLRPVLVREVDVAGRTLAEVRPEAQPPLARLATPLGRGVVFITTDSSAGFGSYSGQLAQLYAAGEGRLTPILAQDPGGALHPVSLVSTLKSGWRLRRPHSGAVVIQQWLCRPDSAGKEQAFTMTYITYALDNGHWIMASRSKPGYFEGEGPWPSREFPGAP